MIRLKVKEIAESKRVTMAKLSRMADLNYGTIRAMYDNPNRDVAVTTLEKIARALKVDAQARDGTLERRIEDALKDLENASARSFKADEERLNALARKTGVNR